VRGIRTPTELWASGTASVVGEVTLHPHNLNAQWDETLANLQALRERAGVQGAWRSMRAYVKHPEQMEAVHDLGLRAFDGGLQQILNAELCRAELLVEVEGMASV
jgi:chorismate lyase/3-hydroxybenzoate synthase